MESILMSEFSIDILAVYFQGILIMCCSARTQCVPFLECVSWLTHGPPLLPHCHLIRSSFSLALAVHHLCTWFSNQLSHYHMLLMDLCVCTLSRAPSYSSRFDKRMRVCIRSLCPVMAVILYYVAWWWLEGAVHAQCTVWLLVPKIASSLKVKTVLLLPE